MNEDRTVAQSIYARVKECFSRGEQRISKSEVIGWEIEYVQGGARKRANGDTKARKLRLLIEANYLGRDTEKGQTYVVPATGSPKAMEDTEPDEGDDVTDPPAPAMRVPISYKGEDDRRRVHICTTPEEVDWYSTQQGALRI